MISNFIALFFLSAATSVVSLHAEMRVGPRTIPMENPRVVHPDTPQGRRPTPEGKMYKKEGQLDIPPLMFGGGYVIGRVKGGFAVEARLAGDRIVALPIPAQLQGSDLTLYYGFCRIPIRHPPLHPELGPRILPHTQITLSIVQWLIHDTALSNYQIHFKGRDLGVCGRE